MNKTNVSGLLIGNHSAHDIAEEYALPEHVTYILLGLHVVIVCISLIGNGFVLIHFLCIKKAKTNANLYLVALAISDILLIIWCEPFTVFNNLINYHWIFGQFLCSSVNYIQTACVIQRSWTLIASSIDRYVAIRWPLKKQTTGIIVGAVIVSIWIASLLIPVPVAIFTDIYYSELDNTSGICQEVWPNSESRQAFSITLLVVTYFIPLLVLTLTYGHIVLILDVKPPGEEYEQLIRRRRAIKRKTIKVFLLAFVTYAVCWLPIHVITIVGDVDPQIYESKLVHILWLFFQCLAVSNSAINPVIVITSGRKLTRRIKREFCSPATERRESLLQNSLRFITRRMMNRRSTQETCV